MNNIKDEDIVNFQKKYIKDRKYTYLILGNKSKLDIEFLKNIGNVEAISLEKLFGY